MSMLKEEELPPPGHVMAIVDAMNKSDFLKFFTKTSLSSESSKSFGGATSLVRTRSSMSLNSSSFDVSSSIEFEACGDSLELEALYDSRFQPTCQSSTLIRTQYNNTKYVCVCSKKKCSFGSSQKQLSKSLSDLELTAYEEPVRKKSFRKYLTSKLEKGSVEKVAAKGSNSKTLPSTSTKKWQSLKIPIETFQVIDTCDSVPNAGAKKRSKFSAIRKLKRDEQQPVPIENNVNGVVNFPISENMNGGVIDPTEAVEVQTKTPSKNWKQRTKQICKKIFKFRSLTPFRILLIALGIFIFLTGATYDLAFKYGIDSAFSSCWNRLQDEYINFGSNFIKYQEHLFKNKGKPDLDSKVFDDNFLSILENIEFSFQMHFFNIKEGMGFTNSKVIVKDIGPLYFKVSFKRDRGFAVKYVQDRSNMSASTTFEVYDIMKAMHWSNQLPYLGFHIKDHYQTTPTALLRVFIDTLNTFQVDTSYFSTLQSQIIDTTNLQYKEPFGGHTFKNSMKSFLSEIFLPLPIDTSKRIDISVPSLKRNLSLSYHSLKFLSGIKSYRFILRDQTSSMINKWSKFDDRHYTNNDIFKFTPYKIREDKIYMNSMSMYSKKELSHSFNSFSLPKNVINLNPVLLKIFEKSFWDKFFKIYPFWMSSPHFLLSQPNNGRTLPSFRDWRDKLDRIDGFAPDESRHGSYIYYHPLLGIPINASIAIQIGVYPPEGMLYSKKLVPVLWIRVQLEKIHPSLWFLFWGSFYIRAIVIGTFMVTGLSIIVCALKCSCGKKCDEQMV